MDDAEIREQELHDRRMERMERDKDRAERTRDLLTRIVAFFDGREVRNGELSEPERILRAQARAALSSK